MLDAAADAEALLDNIINAVTGTSYLKATIDIGGPIDGYVLHSTRFGATASISLVSVSGGSVATAFNDGAGGTLQYDSGGGAADIKKIRVEGGGFYAEANVNPTILTSSIVKFTPGLGQVDNGALDVAISDAENQTIRDKALGTVPV